MPFRIVDEEGGIPVTYAGPAGEEQKPRGFRLYSSPAERFAEQQKRLGVPPEQIQAELGGLHAPPPPTGSTPFNIVRGAANALLLEDPITAALMYPAAGASSALRAGMAFGAFGAERGAREALQQGATIPEAIRAGVGTGIREAAFGATLPFGIAPASTTIRGIVKPLAIGGGVGFLTAPSGATLEERAQSALEGAATFGAFKAVGRGIGAIGNLFARKPTITPSGKADAPAGLTEEVFGPPRPTGLPSFESFGPRGEAERSAMVFEQTLGREENLRQSVRGAQALREDLQRQATTGLPVLPPIRPTPPESVIPQILPITPLPRQGRVQAALPPPLTEEGQGLLGAMRSRFGESAEAPSTTERGMLRQLLRHPNPQVSGEAERVLSEWPQAKMVTPEVIPAEVPKPKMPAPPKFTGRQTPAELQAEAGDVVSAIMDITNRKGIKFGKDVRSDVRQSLINSGLPKNLFNYKSGMPIGDVAEQLHQRGLIASPIENDVIEALRTRAMTGKVAVPTARESEMAMMEQGMRQASNADLFHILQTEKTPDTPLAAAALDQLRKRGIDFKLPETVHINEIGDDTLKGVLQGGQFGPGPVFTKEQVQGAEAIAKKIRPNPNPADDLNKVKESGSINEAAGVEAPRTGIEVKFGQSEREIVDRQAAVAVAATQESLAKLRGEGKSTKPIFVDAALKNPNVQAEIEKWKGRLNVEAGIRKDPPVRVEFDHGFIIDSPRDALAYGAKHINRFGNPTGEIRPLGPNDPFDGTRLVYSFYESSPSRKAFEARAEEKALGSRQRELEVGPRGGAPVSPGGPGAAPTNSMAADMTDFGKRWGQSAYDNEISQAAAKLNQRVNSMQELARQFPEVKPIYDAYHGYIRRAVNEHVDAIWPLYDKPVGVPYFNLPDNQRAAVDKLALQHKVNRQGQPRMSAEQIKATRGFTDNMVSDFNDVLDYGQNMLKAMRGWYIERGMPALIKSGMTPDAARATLEAQAAKALQGMDHWVPNYRRGDKVAMAIDNMNNLLDYRLEPTIKGRVEAIADLKAKYPGATVKEGIIDDFVKSKAFDEIDLASLEILSRFARVDPTISQEFISQIRPTLLQRSDALARFKKFENIPGFKEDLREGLIQSGRSAFNYIERQRAYTKATEALGQIDPEKKELIKFAKQYIDDNMTPGDQRLKAVRDWTYAYGLGLSIKNWPLQLTQFATSVFPEGLKYVSPAKAMTHAETARKWTFTNFKNLRNAPQELQDVWKEAFREGAIQPRAEMYMAESIPFLKSEVTTLPFKQAEIERRMGQQLHSFQEPMKRRLQNIRDFMMVPITDADMRTRFGAVTFFYEMGRKNLNMDIPAATKFAIEEANRTNYLYGRAESPQMFGRKDLALFANMYRTWTTSQLSFLGGLWGEAKREAVRDLAARGITEPGLGQRLGEMGKAAIERPSPARSFASAVGAMFALGGTLYNLPGPIRAALRDGLGVDPETEARKLLSGTLKLPEVATDVALRGVTALAGIDMARSLAIGDTVPSTFADWLGPTPAMIQSIATGTGQLFKTATTPFGPDPLDALEAMLGGGFKNILKGARLQVEQGITTRQGGQLPGSSELRMLDPYLQSLGLTPLAVSKAKALQQASQIELQRHRDQQSSMMEQLSRAIVNQNQDRIDEINDRIRRNNENAMAKDRPDLLITIDRPSLRQRIAEMLAPGANLKRAPRLARQRLMELQDIYLPPPPTE